MRSVRNEFGIIEQLRQLLQLLAWGNWKIAYGKHNFLIPADTVNFFSQNYPIFFIISTPPSSTQDKLNTWIHYRLFIDPPLWHMNCCTTGQMLDSFDFD
jgi:hypothetical protein